MMVILLPLLAAPIGDDVGHFCLLFLQQNRQLLVKGEK